MNMPVESRHAPTSVLSPWVCVICVCMNVCLQSPSNQRFIINYWLWDEYNILTHGIQRLFSFILRTYLLLLTLTQCWSVIPGANAGHKISTVLRHMHGMRQILLLFLYSIPTSTKSSLLMPASAYPSVDNYLLLPFSQPMLLVLSPCSLPRPYIHSHTINILYPPSCRKLHFWINPAFRNCICLHTSVLLISTIIYFVCELK